VHSFLDLVNLVAAKLDLPERVRQVLLQRTPDPNRLVPPDDFLAKAREMAQLAVCIAAPEGGKPLVYMDGPPGTTVVTKDYLMSLGQYWWPLTFGNGYRMDTLDTTARMGKAMLNMLVQVNATWAYKALQEDPSSQELMLGAAQWAHNAYPVLQLGGHRYAAALMATSVPDVEILPPWSSFIIDLPTNFLFTANSESGVDEPIDFIHVTTIGDKWSILAHSRSVNLHRTKWPVREMTSDKSLTAFPEATGGSLDTRDSRTLVLLTRLVLNTCLAMSDPANVKQVGKHKSAMMSPKEGGRTNPEPLARTFRVGKPIELDVRPALADYLEGKRRSSPTIQSLVRGHWKFQAHGPNHSLRKAIHIEPYWRGPEDAPITVRAHVVGGKP